MTVSVQRIALGDNNVYLVTRGAEAVLIDAGPDYRGAREELLAAVGGIRPDVVVATHGHLDHAGLGGWWQSRDVPVLLGGEDVPLASGEADAHTEMLANYVRNCGAPEAVVAEVLAGLELRAEWTRVMRSPGEWTPARDRRWPSALKYAGFVATPIERSPYPLPCGLVAVAAPGHTPGNLVVVQPELGWLFSGDTLLPEITPTPAVQFHDQTRFHSLPRFLQALRGIRREWPHLTRCYPGHGLPFENVEEVIDANLDQAVQRSERLLEVLAEGSGTVYALAEQLYPRALRRRFWQIISTVQGQLDVLEDDRLAVCLDGDWTLVPA